MRKEKTSDLEIEIKRLKVKDNKLKNRNRIIKMVVILLFIVIILFSTISFITAILLCGIELILYFKMYKNNINAIEKNDNEIKKLKLRINALSNKNLVEDENIIKVYENYIKSTGRECYTMKIVEGVPSMLDSHIGGVPYMPLNERWPLNKCGNEIPLLIQINFDKVDLPQYPNKGILQIFYCWETNEQDIKYYENISNDFQENNVLPPRFYNEGWSSGHPLKLELMKDLRVRPIDGSSTFSKEFSKVYGKYDYEEYKEEIHIIWNKLNQYISKGNIGGWAASAQGAFDNVDNNLTESDNQVFIFIDSLLHDCINIGDSGYIWGEIKTEDLKNKKFDKICIKSDSY